jgi:hypothetical protein
MKIMVAILAEPEFWYENFHNWKSEILPIGVLLVLGIDLRERGLPEFKPVASPHAATDTDDPGLCSIG